MKIVCSTGKDEPKSRSQASQGLRKEDDKRRGQKDTEEGVSKGQTRPHGTVYKRGGKGKKTKKPAWYHVLDFTCLYIAVYELC